jgi:hypothetical protein
MFETFRCYRYRWFCDVSNTVQKNPHLKFKQVPNDKLTTESMSQNEADTLRYIYWS